MGTFVLAAFAVIFGLFFINSKTAHFLADRVTYHAFLSNAEGISTETTVRVSGIEVGRVTNIDISRDNRIHVTIEVFERFQNLIRTDSQAAIGKLSVLGKSTIEIKAGSTAQPVLADGATLHVEEPLSMDQLMAQLTPVMLAVKESVEKMALVVQTIEPEQMGETFESLNVAAANLRSITDQIASGRGAVGTAIYDRQFQADIRRTVTTLEASLSKTNARLAQLEPLIQNMTAISSNTRRAAENLPQLVEESKQLVLQMNAAMATLNVEMQRFPELMTRMRMLMEQTDRTLEGLTQTWPFSGSQPQTEGRLIEVQTFNE